jgi:FHA domain
METVIVIEVLGAHDRIVSRHRLVQTGDTATCTIGRGAAADVIVDDPHVAAVHARVSVDAAGIATVTDLGTVNGIEVGGRHVHGAFDEPVAGIVRIGRTRLRVRTATETLPAELPEHEGVPVDTRARDFRWLATGVAVATAAMIFSIWTSTTESRELVSSLVAGLLIVFAVGCGWIAVWALVSRVGLGESRWVRHAAIFFCAIAAIEVISMLVDIVAGAFGIFLPASAAMLIFGLVAAAALALHLLNAGPMRRRFALAIGVLIPALTLGTGQWMLWRGQDRSAYYIPDGNEIVPPALMLHSGAPLDTYVAGLDKLKAQADAKRAFVEKEDPSPEESSDD